MKGNLKQQRQNVQSTQTQHKSELNLVQIEEQTNNVFATIVHYRNKIFTDATGLFPITSSRSNIYVFVLDKYDSNYIMVELVNNWKKTTKIEAYKNN